jgi:hypothetical protein
MVGEEGRAAHRPPPRLAGSRSSAPFGLGPDRHRGLLAGLARRPWRVLLDHGHLAGLPLCLQLVHQAHLRPPVHGPLTGRHGRGDGAAQGRGRADHLWFTDDIFGLGVDWICAFADEVRRAEAATAFSMQSRVNLMTDRSPLWPARARGRFARRRIRFAEGPRCDGQGFDGRGGGRSDARPEASWDQGVLVHPARISVGDLGRPADEPGPDPRGG